MQSFLQQLSLTDGLVMLLGLALIVFGRRLYWMALGGLGFFFGLWLASQFLGGSTTGLELGLAFLVSILCAWFAVWAQKMAIRVGGFLLGAAGGFWLATAVLAQAFQWRQDLSIWIVAAVGAVIGVALASMLFDAALVLITSLAGAVLMASRAGLEPPRDVWLVIILLCVGILIQSRRGGEEREEE